MSGIGSSFSRCTFTKLELNIDHLINVDVLIPWGVFSKRILLLFLRLCSHPSTTVLLYPSRRCREARGGVGQIITLFSTFLQLRKEKDAKTNVLMLL